MSHTGLNVSLRPGPTSPPSPSATLFKEIDDADLAILATASRAVAAEPTQSGNLFGPQGAQRQGLKRLRDTHHALARLIAVGSSNIEASALTGYDPSYISLLKGDPAFKELVQYYRSNLDLAQSDIVARMSGLSNSFLAELQQRLEDEPEKMSNTFVLEALKVLLDRTGHAPVSKTINVNVDLASRLESARRRVGQALPSPASGDVMAPEAGPLLEGN